jgi:ElaB/YqjD/DUF883 family membrane-anchored ribosome-binding protein
MANDDRQQTIDEFDDNVNMTRKELEDWLQTDESKSVGQGEGESKGHESGRRIVELLEKNKSDYTDDDLDHMKKVNSYVKRRPGDGGGAAPDPPRTRPHGRVHARSRHQGDVPLPARRPHRGAGAGPRRRAGRAEARRFGEGG